MNTLRNKVQLIGNIGNDPEVKKFDSGKTFARFSLATREMHKDKDGNKVAETCWHKLVAWGHLASIAEKFLSKGREIAIEGKLTNRSYEDKEGNRRLVTEIIVTDLVMLGSK
jgi:single-strand DNA-binding protein